MYVMTTFTNFLTLLSRILINELIVAQIVEKFLVFYGTRWLVTIVPRASHYAVT